MFARKLSNLSFTKSSKPNNSSTELDDKGLKTITEIKSMLEKDNWDTGSVLIEHLIKSYPNNADANWLYGRLQGRKQDFSTALFHFEKCLKLNSEHADCHCSYGVVSGLRGKFKDEEKAYLKCLQLNSQHHICHYNYAVLLSTKGLYEKSDDHFKQAIQLNSNDSNYHLAYAQLLKTMRKFDDACVQLDKAIAIDSENDRLYYNYAMLLENMKQTEKALVYLKKAIKMNHSNTDYLRILHNMTRKVALNKKSYIPANIQRKLPANAMDAMTRESSQSCVVTTTPGGPSEFMSDLLANDISAMNTQSSINSFSKSPSPSDIMKSVPKPKAKTRQNKAMTAENVFSFATGKTIPIKILKQYTHNDDDDDIEEKKIDVRNDDDEYFKKAVSLYENGEYNEAQKVLEAVLLLNKGHESAQRLHKYLSNKMYNNNGHASSPYRSPKSMFAQIPPPPPPLPVMSLTGTRSRQNSITTQQKMSDMKINEEMKENDEPNQCKIEFERFLSNRVKLFNQYPDLLKRFEKCGYDDIRFVMDFDMDILESDIGLKKLHCKTFLKKVEIFREECGIFQSWLRMIACGNQQFTGMKGLIDRFENRGILIFESLYRYVMSLDDLNEVIGKQYHNINQVLWNEIGKQQTRLMQSRTQTVGAAFAQQTPGLGVATPGKSEGNVGTHGNEEGKTEVTEPIK